MIKQYLRSWYTIKNRIILIVSALLGCVFFIVGIVVYQQVKGARYDIVDVRLEALSQNLRNEIDEQFREHTFPSMKEFNRIITHYLPASLIRIYDSTGAVVYEDSLLSGYAYSLPANIRQHQNRSKNTYIHALKYRLFWSKMEVLENHQWVVLIATSIEYIEEDMGQLRFILWSILSIAVLFSAIIVNIVVRRSFAPLTRIINTTNLISESSLHERIGLRQSFDEVSLLSSSVNRMIERLEVSFKNQKQFIANASHELRTPLAIIQSELEYANRSSRFVEAKRSVRIALKELDYMRKLSSDLLLLAKLENSYSKELQRTIRLDELLTDVVQRMTRLAHKKKISLRLTLHNPIEIRSDEDQLRGAFINIIDNAIKYTPIKGIVRLDLCQQDQQTVITIQDAGIGIHLEDIPHIFKPFYRSSALRSKAPGSGLGLSIVKKIIELHQGTIEVQSDGKSGSTFIICFPIQQ
ncbi:MAG: HAMP domain-containing sensor histidine kinase [Bacteroidota bacterium]